MLLGLECFAEHLVPQETLNGVGGGESCCTLIGKWFQELGLACSARVFQGRWEMPGQPGEGRKGEYKSQNVAKGSVSCQEL